MAVLGVTTNVPFVRDLLGRDDVRGGVLDTGLVERLQIDAPAPPDLVLVVAWLLRLVRSEGRGPWEQRSGWRLGGPTWIPGHVVSGGRSASVRVRRTVGGWLAAVDGGEPIALRLDLAAARVAVESAGVTTTFDWAVAADVVWLAADGRVWEVTVRAGPLRPERAQPCGRDGAVTSPMPGSVVALLVSPGQPVSAGQKLAAVEAMKMEHMLTAPFSGVVRSVHVAVGQQVTIKQLIVTVTAEEESTPP
jgi:acetyl-CoA/propionyl-CoA carboxylase biotin carboxyl carrier protein